MLQSGKLPFHHRKSAVEELFGGDVVAYGMRTTDDVGLQVRRDGCEARTHLIVAALADALHTAFLEETLELSHEK